jgi:predicted MFS family arabinose efflux permease
MLADQVSLSYILAALGIIFIVSCVVFIYREKHFAHPLLDLSIFNDKKFTLPAVSMILFFIGNFMLSIVGPFYFQGVMGYTASQVGIIFLISPIIMVFGSPIFGWLYDKHYSKYYAFAGMGIVAISFTLLGLVAKRADLALIIFAFILSAIGGSMYQSPNNTDTMSAVPRRKLGTASSVTSTMRNLGMALGVSLATILISLQLHLSGYTGPILEAGAPLLSSVISIVMFCSGAICVVSAIAALLRNI